MSQWIGNVRAAKFLDERASARRIARAHRDELRVGRIYGWNITCVSQICASKTTMSNPKAGLK